MVSAAIAAAVGVRAESCMSAVPSRIRGGVGAAPGQRGECVGTPRLGRPDGVEPELLGLGDDPA